MQRIPFSSRLILIPLSYQLALWDGNGFIRHWSLFLESCYACSKSVIGLLFLSICPPSNELGMCQLLELLHEEFRKWGETDGGMEGQIIYPRATSLITHSSSLQLQLPPPLSTAAAASSSMHLPSQLFATSLLHGFSSLLSPLPSSYFQGGKMKAERWGRWEMIFIPSPNRRKNFAL